MGERHEHFGQEDHHERRVKLEATRFEEMLSGESFHFFDSMMLEDIYFYYLRHNKIKNALKLVNYALQRNPYGEDLFFKRATVLYELSRLTEAMRDVQRALEQNPLQMEYVFLKAEILSQLGKYDGAQTELENYLSLTDSKEEVWFQMETDANHQPFQTV